MDFFLLLIIGNTSDKLNKPPVEFIIKFQHYRRHKKTKKKL